MSAKAVALVLKILSSKDGRDGLRTVLTVLAAVLLAIVLLVAAVVDILMTPFAFVGELGAFQEQYAYLVEDETVEEGEQLPEDKIDDASTNTTDDPTYTAIY